MKAGLTKETHRIAGSAPLVDAQPDFRWEGENAAVAQSLKYVPFQILRL